MRTKLITTLVVFAATLNIISCGGPASYQTAGVMKKWHDSIRNKDIKTYKETTSTEVTLKKEGNPNGLTIDTGQDDNFMKMLIDALQKTHSSENMELRNEKVTGDTATVEWKDSEEKWHMANLSKANGEWKIVRTN